jgi:hypothetical protein
MLFAVAGATSFSTVGWAKARSAVPTMRVDNSTRESALSAFVIDRELARHVGTPEIK